MPRIVWILLSIVSLLVPWGVALWLSPTLAEKYPVHFDFAGTPDRWAGPSQIEWFLLPAIATVVQGLLLASIALTRWLAVRAPEYVNIPSKELFLRLPPDARVRCVAGVEGFMSWMSFGISLLFANILWVTWRVASGATATATISGVWIFLVVTLGGVAWMWWKVSTAVRVEAARTLR